MARKSPASISVDPNVRCERIYPIEKAKKSVSDLKTVGVRLNNEQAVHLARALLAVAQDWESMDITGYRFERRRSDGTYRLTVTGR